MLARTYGSNAGNELLGHWIAADAIASSEHGQWTERVEHIAQTAERFPTQGQTGTHGRLQSMLQGVQVRMEPLPAQPWIEPCQGLGGKMQTFAAFLDTVLPPFV